MNYTEAQKKNFKIKAFMRLKANGITSSAAKAGVFKASEGLIPTCNCNLEQYGTHSPNCQLEQAMIGYDTYQQIVREIG